MQPMPNATVPESDPYSFTIQIKVGIEFWAGMALFWCCFMSWCRYSETPSKFMARRVARLEDWIIAFSSRFLVELCSDERVQQSMSKMMASGINLWLTHPATPGHLTHFWSHAPEHIAAEQLGRNAPTLAKSFLDGLLSQCLYNTSRLVYNETRFLRKVVGLGLVCHCVFVPYAS